MFMGRTASPCPKAPDLARDHLLALCTGEIAWKRMYEQQQQITMHGANPPPHMGHTSPTTRLPLPLRLVLARYHDPKT